MTHTFRFVLALLTAVSVLGACAPAAKTSPPSRTGGEVAKTTPRSPEGVVLEMSASVPAPTEVARADAVAVLAEPIPDEAVRDFVFAYFDMLRRRDSDGLVALVSENGVTLDKGSTYGNRDALLLQLATQWKRTDYGKIAPAEIALPERIERFSVAELEAMDRKRPEPMKPLDVLVRIAMPAIRGTNERLFEDYVFLLLRVEGGKLKIVSKVEEAGPWL